MPGSTSTATRSRCPGRGSIVSSGGSGPRGALNVDGVWYVVYEGIVKRIDSAAVTTLNGSIPGPDGVTLAMNSRTQGGG